MQKQDPRTDSMQWQAAAVQTPVPNGYNIGCHHVWVNLVYHSRAMSHCNKQVETKHRMNSRRSGTSWLQ
eukprot:6464389-Amphidinium_carterae.2